MSDEQRDPPEFICDECGRRFDTQEGLWAHACQ